jgi:hypothetical protein
VFIGALAFAGKPELWTTYTEGLLELAALIDSGNLVVPKVTVLGQLSLETVQKAHDQLEHGHTKGKLVVTIP